MTKIDASFIAKWNIPSPPRAPTLPNEEYDNNPTISIGRGLGSQLAKQGTDTTNIAKNPSDFSDLAGKQSREGVLQVIVNRETMLDIGSGWVAKTGLIVTNHHVIANAKEGSELIVKDYKGQTHEAKIIVDDPAHDLALLSVSNLDDTPLPMDDVVERNEYGVGTGYPGGKFKQYNATAYIGAKLSSKTYESMDAILFAGDANPGASGGAIINASGEVIGTTVAGGVSITALDYSGPIFAAIPNNYVRDMLEKADKLNVK